MVATKEQEQTRIIVEDLGEHSYVGHAMDGALEIAEKNIEDDAACSLKKALEISDKRVQDLELTLKRVREVSNRRYDIIQRLTSEREEAKMSDELMWNLFKMLNKSIERTQQEMLDVAEQMATMTLAGDASKKEAEKYKKLQDTLFNYKRTVDELKNWKERQK